MKKSLAAILLTISLVVLAACGSSSTDPNVIVKTSGNNVTKEEFYEALKDSPEAEQILTDLVTINILEGKFDITDEDIDQKFEQIKRDAGESFADVLEMQGLTEDQYKKLIKESLLKEALISEDVEITDEEIESYYNNMKKEIHARHILVEEEELANDLKAQLDDGADFEKLAKEHSIDTSASKGGDLGFFSIGKLVGPAFENTAFSLEVNEISEVVYTDWGYHIVEVLEITELDEDIGTLEENELNIRSQIIQQKVDPEDAMEKLNNLFEDNEIEVKVDRYKDLFKNVEVEEDNADLEEGNLNLDIE